MTTLLDWANPDYLPILQKRAMAIKNLRENPGLRTPLTRGYRQDWVAFINDWFITFDPRKEGSNKYAPFILFPRQKEFVKWVRERWKNRERGIGEKSREVGFTWLAAACAVCVWLFEDHAVVGFGSRKKEYVDNGPNDPDSIFWKVRCLIDLLPIELLPSEHKNGRKWGIIPNPSNGSVIKGEIGDEIGRGGRASLYFVDEFAHLDRPAMAESALSANTDCRIYISTVNGVGNLFYELRMFLPEEQVFVFDWTEDPRKRLKPNIPPKEEPWYKKKERELLPIVLASQVNRDYNASVANSFLETETILEAENRPLSKIDQPPQTPWSIGIDAAGQGSDEIIIWLRRGRINLPCVAYSKLDGVQLAAIVERKATELIRIAPIALISIERDGPGGSCADQLKYGPYASILRAVHTGAKLKNGQHYNFRAYLHDQGKTYLLENAVHLPRDPIFRTQATSVQEKYKGGLLLMESKEEYRARFAAGKSKEEKRAGKSPDRYDAFNLTFVPPSSRPIAQDSVSVSRFAPNRGGWKPLDAVIGY